MKDALGMVEVYGFALAVDIADTMLKTANIQLEDLKITRGIGWLTIAVEGNVGAVNAAILAGTEKAKAMEGYISSKVIPRPIPNIFGEKPEAEPKQAEVDESKEKPTETQSTEVEKQSNDIGSIADDAAVATEDTSGITDLAGEKTKEKKSNGKKKVKKAKRTKEDK